MMRSWFVAVTLALACASCSTTPAPQLPTEPLPRVFDSGVPEPTGEVVLTITLPGGRSADWDLGALRELPQQDLTITEPFLDEEHEYTGPLLADVLRASGVDLETSSEVEVVALDDFVADLPITAEGLDGLLLAHLEDGAEIELADGGPIRLIFPSRNPVGENLNNWVWSVRSGTVQ